MKKHTFLHTLSLCLSLLLLGGSMAACGGSGTGTTDTGTVETTAPAGESTTGESTTVEGTTPVPGPTLTGPYSSAIQYASEIANGVQARYTDPERTGYRIENRQMSLEYSLPVDSSPMVTALRNTKGEAYVENTMDAFIRMEDGRLFLASDTSKAARPNIFKYGYYYYELHFLDQDFIGEYSTLAEKQLRLSDFKNLSSGASNLTVADGTVSFTVAGGDPYIYAGAEMAFPAKTYNAVRISIRSGRASQASLYFLAGGATGHSPDQCATFPLIPDGEFHTYTVILSEAPGYTGSVNSLRLDVDGATEGDVISVNAVSAVQADTDVPAISLDRTLHTYSDKLHEVLHFVTAEDVSGIAGLGMITRISADRVDALIAADAAGVHTSLDGVDWFSVTYVGFDIRGVGVFGYILPQHETSGNLTVTLSDGAYIVTQEATPKGGSLSPSTQYTENDFFMGHRIYTDESHDFGGLSREAGYEREPLTTLGGDTYTGYDALRGAYAYTIGGTSFNPPYYTSWNRHYEADVTIRGGDEDRRIYIYTNCATNGGCTEGAVLMDERDLLIPIPTMIFKNFGGEDEEPIFYHGDQAYSMTLFPMTVDAGADKTFTVVNAMQNWGTFPLKQLSSIQFHAPYYHLSTGVTETSCIAPWYVHGKSLWTLPDFRPMSGIWWYDYEDDRFDNQPQHTHAGYHYFLQYTDAEGQQVQSENTENTILSSGQHYAEVVMDYLSDDGKIRISYSHLEMPQTDEHRAYYEITYEVLEDVTIESMMRDFSFLSTTGYAGTYTQMGYINRENKIAHTAAPTEGFTHLGDNAPYVSFYGLKGAWEQKCANTGFLIYDADLTIGGASQKAEFILRHEGNMHYLTLELGRTTLKKGDILSLDLVIVPWGSEESENDDNMIRLRENTALAPLTVSVQEGERMESVFLPRVRATNGTSAEFTLSGGANNVAVRVYGFDKLTAPRVYEWMEGEWVPYITSSVLSPDIGGNRHAYDGYCVYYDGDGTYSYTFPVDMTGGGERTFRIDASADFESWDSLPDHSTDAPLNIYAGPVTLQMAALGHKGLRKAELAEDGSFVRFYGDGKSGEAFFTVYTADEPRVTGQYLAIRYRFPKGGKKSDFQIYTSTQNPAAVAADYFSVPGLVDDGEWHTLILDLAEQGLPTFEPGADGSYTALHLRLDIFNTVTPTEGYVDLAFIGLCEDRADIDRLLAEIHP